MIGRGELLASPQQKDRRKSLPRMQPLAHSKILYELIDAADGETRNLMENSRSNLAGSTGSALAPGVGLAASDRANPPLALASCPLICFFVP
jgi:hypothetical protein